MSFLLSSTYIPDLSSLPVVGQKMAPSNTISDETREFINWHIDFVVIPAVSVLGILGNLTIVVVISVNGLRKSSNIFLVALAVADLCFLVGSSNIFSFIYHQNGGFPYDENISFIVYVVYHIISFIYHVGTFCSLSLPVLITVDRLVAVFFPFHVKSLVTPVRARFVVIALFIWFGVVAAYISFCFTFIYMSDSHLNLSLAVMRPSSLRTHPSYSILQQLINILTQTFPLFFVLIGCVVIGFKVKVSAARRNRMTSRMSVRKHKAMTSKTTRTLMAICVVFCLSSGFAYILFLYEPDDFNLELILRKVRQLILCMNSSCNFLIYVAFNQNFRVTLLYLGRHRKPQKSNMTGTTEQATHVSRISGTI